MMENKKTTLQQDSPPPKGLGMMLSSSPLSLLNVLYNLQKWWDCWAARSNYEDLKLSYPRSPRCIHIPGICFEIDLYLLVVNSMNA